MEGGQFKAEVAYGFPAANDYLTLTPGVAVALSPDSRSYGILWSLAPYARQGHRPNPGKSPWRGSGNNTPLPLPPSTIPSNSPSPSSSEF